MGLFLNLALLSLRFSVVCDLTRPQAADLKDMSQKHPLIPDDVDAEELVYSAQHRAKMYYDGETRQWCWAHLKRDIQKLIDNPNNQSKRLGNDLMKLERFLFEHWRAYRDAQKTWRGFQLAVAPIRKEFNALLLRG